MKQNFKKACWQMRMNPFVGPLLAGWAVFALTLPLIGVGRFYAALLLWGALWAVLERAAPKGYPKSHVRLLTPNFFAVRDIAGCWRIFQRRPERVENCKALLRELLEDQHRLPASLTTGLYRTLTHDTILNRLRGMGNVAILSSSPAYMATLEDTITRAVGRRCQHCTERCPFRGKRKLRQFYEVRFLVS